MDQRLDMSMKEILKLSDALECPIFCLLSFKGKNKCAYAK